jgi:hypothetical protein
LERRDAMATLWRKLQGRVASDAAVAAIGQLACFAAAPAVMVLALLGTVRFAGTPGEIFLGVLGSAGLALLLVILGLLLPLGVRKTDP